MSLSIFPIINDDINVLFHDLHNDEVPVYLKNQNDNSIYYIS